jgi:rod shape-determining protein MreC
VNSVKNFSINKKGNGWLTLLIGAVAFLFLIFILNIFTVPIKNCFYAISYPIRKTFWSAGAMSSNFFGSFFKAGSLAKENEDLQKKNQELLSQVATLQSIEEGNQALSAASVSCQNNGLQFVMAGVIGLDDNDMLSINKGSVDGISEGMPVVDQQNVLFGKVFKVYKNFSSVMLISNKNSVINIKIMKTPVASRPEGYPGFGEPKEIDGVVKGSGGLSAYLDLIPIDEDINAQDVLVTSAIEKYFPKDLLVGKIIQKEKNDQKPFQEASIQLFFDVKTADNLFVVTNYKR